MVFSNITSDCINTGDTTWVLISSILVLSMMPALAFFEGFYFIIFLLIYEKTFCFI
jgi:hypothetical protein